ncbi:hypothetical protein NQ318_022574 [Aromia moschata]|uniref:Uncharacterized protein n=1 Tax=Aromia moschata TaxID=1265417 RepID=A0AAV8XWA3_9CUCU|nr:hypothetical protein NQ318_022574 [Aromia moschata]
MKQMEKIPHKAETTTQHQINMVSRFLILIHAAKCLYLYSFVIIHNHKLQIPISTLVLDIE